MAPHRPEELDEWQISLVKAAGLEPGEYDTLYILPQGAGYDDIYVAHLADLTVIAQRHADYVLMYAKEAARLAEVVQETSQSPYRKYKSGELESSNGNPWELAWNGIREGNPGDWTLAMRGTDYKNRLKGNHGLEKLAEALLRR